MPRRVQVILQARIGSKRLYGKSAIPIINEPLVILCNKRLKSKNLKITTIIPNKKEDDYLAYILKKNNFNFFRGASLNVLERFKRFTKNFRNEEIIVRVTADNPFVDGKFLNKLIKIYKKYNLEYLSAHENISKIPYGIQAEIFKVKHLREINSQEPYSSEHVTPLIRKKYFNKEINIFIKNYSGISKLKLSIDTIKDLERVKKIFSNYNGSPYDDLSKIIKNKKVLKLEKNTKKSYILLGTVQIGKKYFQKNVDISQRRANNLLSSALKEKINFFDTAYNYGRSEEFIGNFKSSINNNSQIFITSKLSNLKNNKNLSKDELIKKINFSIFESLNKLKCSHLDNFLIHNSYDLFRSRVVYKHLNRFLASGIIKNLGASIYTPNEFSKLKKYKNISCVQLPFNLIDSRWIKILSKKKNYPKIFVRSLFLRGNLKEHKINFPNKNQKFENFNKHLRNFCIQFKKKNFFELTLAYAKAFIGINYLVIGAQTQSHIKKFSIASKVKRLNESQKQKIIKLITKNFKPKDVDLRNWN